MRSSLLPALLLFALSAPNTLCAQSLEFDGPYDGLLPPGSAADLVRDRGVPAAGEGPIEYVIVTSRSLRPEFLVLGRERIRAGITSTVRSLESLRSDYPSALDDAERVRRFLRDAHDHWGTRWVLLGGDTEVIPPRFATLGGFLGARTIVSDWYYACLDGTWDADGDGLYAEEPNQFGDPGDSPDLEPELFVGRAPVSDKAEARRFVEKTLAYERRPPDAFENTTLLFANRFVYGIDFAPLAEQLLPRITDDPAQQVTRLYESWDDSLWVPGALPETRQSVIDALNQGHNVVLGFGAGNPALLEVGMRSGPDPQLLTVADALGLANGERAGHMWLLTSQVGAFDQPTSLAEAFLRAPEGGAVTVIAPSDLTFIFQGFQLMRRFVEVVFDEGAASIGEALVRARSSMVFPTGGPSIVLSYQLLGDPLLRVFHSSPVASARGPDHGRTEITRASRPRDERDAADELTVIRAVAAPPPGTPATIASPHLTLALSRPAPSPAVSTVSIECAFPSDRAGADLEAGILDLAGRTARTLNPGAASGRNAALTWDLRADDGRRVRPGVYFLRVRAGAEIRTARLVVADGP